MTDVPARVSARQRAIVEQLEDERRRVRTLRRVLAAARIKNPRKPKGRRGRIDPERDYLFDVHEALEKVLGRLDALERQVVGLEAIIDALDRLIEQLFEVRRHAGGLDLAPPVERDLGWLE